MNRRDFLTRMTGASLAGLAAASLPAALEAAAAPDRLLRAGDAGCILESLDGGTSWQRAAQFGTGLDVAEVRRAGDAFYARLRFGPEREHGFWLCSTDGRAWRTAEEPGQA